MEVGGLGPYREFVSDIYLVNFGGEDSPDRFEREAEERRTRSNWTLRLAEKAGLTDELAHQVMSVVFDHVDQTGQALPLWLPPTAGRLSRRWLGLPMHLGRAAP